MMPKTFKHTDFANDYRLCTNRGDRNAVFLNKAVYGETDESAAAKIKEMNRRYGLFGHFKQFNQYVIKGSTCRLATNGEKHRGPSLIPTPSGKSYAEWSALIVDAMIGDLKWWTCKEDWLGFWKTGFEKCGVYIHDENEKVLEESAAKHVWLEVSKFQRKIAESMVARYCDINKMGRN
jgi:hypothetical protein